MLASALGPAVRRLAERARRWSRTQFVTNMGVILRANILIQLVSIAAVPILTRIYGPTEYGLFAILLLVNGYLAQLCFLRLDAAVDIPREEEDAIALLHLCVMLAAGVVALTAAATWLAPGLVARLLGHPELADLVIYLPLWVAAAAVGTLLSTALARRRDFATQANTRLALAFVDVGGKAALGLAGFLRHGQIVGSIVSAGLLVAVLGFRARVVGVTILKGFDAGRALAAGWAYRKFPALNFPTMLLETAALAAPAFLIGHYFGAAAVGLFYVADRLTAAPAYAISGAVRPVFKRDAAILAAETGDVRPLVRRTLLMTAPVGLAFAAAVILGAPLAFDLLFDDRWAQAAAIAQIIAAARWLDIVINPITPILLVRQRHKTNLCIQAGFLAATIAAFHVGAQTGELHQAIALYAAALVGKYAAELVMSLHAARSGPPLARQDTP